MIESETITQAEEKRLLQEWFDTTAFPDSNYAEGELPPLEPEDDDEESRALGVKPDPLKNVDFTDLMEELRRRDPDNPF